MYRFATLMSDMILSCSGVSVALAESGGATFHVGLGPLGAVHPFNCGVRSVYPCLRRYRKHYHVPLS